MEVTTLEGAWCLRSLLSSQWLELALVPEIPPLQYLALLPNIFKCTTSCNIVLRSSPSNMFHSRLLQYCNHPLLQVKVMDLPVCFSIDEICTWVLVASLVRNVQDPQLRSPILQVFLPARPCVVLKG
jgi:hypothetical protein